jgi:hypothetical protein
MDDQEMSGQEMHELISRWAGESKNLLLALPALLAKLAQLQGEANQLRNRIMDLELENANLRQGRAELAETFAKMKDLMAATALEGPAAQDAFASSAISFSEPAELDPAEPEPAEPSEPEPSEASTSGSADPSPADTVEPGVEEPAEPVPEAPAEARQEQPVSQSAGEPAREPAPEPPPASGPPSAPEPPPRTTPEPPKPKGRWPAPGRPAAPKPEEPAPAQPPVRFSSAFRPPASKN